MTDPTGKIPQMKEFLSKYTSNLPSKSNKNVPARKLKNVVVSGTTGSLGYYLVVSLLKDSKTGTIYCLNRSGEAKENFWSRYKERNDQVTVPEGKLKFIKVSFGDDMFGLDKATFNELSEDIDIVIHNAWKVNFKHDLSSFESQIRGLYTLICISLSSPHHPSIYFTSSIGVASRPNIPLVPEAVIPSPDALAIGTGYAQSKWVCENMLDYVYRTYNLDMNVLRLGQLSGPIHDMLGAWNTTEWVPLLIKSSKAMRLLPDQAGSRDIDWIPADTSADICVEIIYCPKSSIPATHPGAPVFHLVNPATVRFKALAPAIQEYFGNGTLIVPFTEWVDRLGDFDRSKREVVDRYPALKLYNMFNGMRMPGKVKHRFDSTRAEKASRTLREFGAVTRDMTRIWLRQWKL